MTVTLSLRCKWIDFIKGSQLSNFDASSIQGFLCCMPCNISSSCRQHLDGSNKALPALSGRYVKLDIRILTIKCRLLDVLFALINNQCDVPDKLQYQGLAAKQANNMLLCHIETTSSTSAPADFEGFD